MKPYYNVESFHSGNGRHFTKIKLNLSKAMNKNKPSSRVSTRGASKKQANDFVIELGSNLAKLNEKLDSFSKIVFELLGNCAEAESHTKNIAHEISELRQKNNVDGPTHDGIE